MITNLRHTTERNSEQDWLKTNLARVTGLLQGQRDLITVGKMLLTELVPLVNAHQGLIYQMDTEAPSLKMLASYGNAKQGYPDRLPLGQGFLGQCAADKRRILITSVPRDAVVIGPDLLQAVPRSLVVFPVVFEGQIKAVLGLASLNEFSETHLTFLEQLTTGIGIVLNSIEATMQTESLLKQSQQLTNDLQTQQKELQQTNEQLAQKAQQLADQNAEVERKNKEVELARRALEEKAAELALTSKYKSEFLANMSHELRTPLNSILILGQQMAENPTGNLMPKQVDFAKNIHSAGSDLLNLINDILDLSKIESGTVTVEVEEITFSALRESVERNFRHVAEAKKLPFDVELNPTLPRAFSTDPKRLQQIIKNLLSNAFKFTAQGSVSMKVRTATQGWSADHPVLSRSPHVIAIQIDDTGIGIAPEKQKIVFEAFQQADAGTSRKYGGTGLGLAISRELAALLGGEIRLTSVLGQGSTFTLYLPLAYTSPSTMSTAPVTTTLAKETVSVASLPVLPMARKEEIPDDRAEIHEGDTVLLIIEDDPHYARVLLGLARDKGFKGIVATRGQEGLVLARRYVPTAITLDIFLPDMLGWTVLNNLKLEAATRHIPVQIISLEEERQHGLAHGAFSYLVKPVTTTVLEQCFDRIKNFVAPHRKQLLVVEDNKVESDSIVELLGSDDLEIATVSTGKAALESLLDRPFDCCVLDLRLPDISGFDLLQKVQNEPTLRDVPIVVFTGKELSTDEEAQLKTVAKSIVLKNAQSPERLFDETALFLHRVVANLPKPKQEMLERLHNSNEALHGRKVLVVDDDARNIFALATVLENATTWKCSPPPTVVKRSN